MVKDTRLDIRRDGTCKIGTRSGRRGVDDEWRAEKKVGCDHLNDVSAIRPLTHFSGEVKMARTLRHRATQTYVTSLDSIYAIKFADSFLSFF